MTATTASRAAPLMQLEEQHGGHNYHPLPEMADPAEPWPVTFPETAVLDWTLRRISGREEGNYVGRYLDTARQMERLPLR